MLLLCTPLLNPAVFVNTVYEEEEEEKVEGIKRFDRTYLIFIFFVILCTLCIRYIIDILYIFLSEYIFFSFSFLLLFAVLWCHTPFLMC